MSSADNKQERITINFSKANEVEMELLEFIEDNSKITGKSIYIKQILFQEMKRLKEGNK